MTATAAPVYVYGVLSAADGAEVRAAGVEGASVEVVEYDGLAALVSRLEGSALAAAREIRAHWRVLDEAARTATVLPVRFGTVLPDAEAVRETMLARDGARLTAMLDRLAGCVQMSVKGTYDEERLLRDVVAASPAIAALRERLRRLPEAAGYYDRIRLGELVAAGVAQRREQDTARARQLLDPLALATHEGEPARPEAAFDLALLIRRDGEGALTAGVHALAEELEGQVAIRYVGPLPPSSFADAQPAGAGSGAWA